MSSFRRRMMMCPTKKAEYLRMDILTDGNITFNFHKGTTSDYAESISYSKDNGVTWTKLVNTPNKTAAKKYTVNVVTGDVLLWKGKATCYSNPDGSYTFSNFAGSAKFNVSGNIMSMLGEDDFSSLETIPTNYCFRQFFNTSKVIDASGLKFPATTLKSGCYRQIFLNCTSLKIAPKKLLAPDVGRGAYHESFCDCSSLITPPILTSDNPNGSYNNSMFKNCTSLTKAPDLNFTGTLDYHYRGMFNGCTKLSYVKMLATHIKGGVNPTMDNWLNGVSETGIFVKNINADWNVSGASGVPTNWTIIYYNPETDKYYLSDKTTECDDHGNVIQL